SGWRLLRTDADGNRYYLSRERTTFKTDSNDNPLAQWRSVRASQVKSELEGQMSLAQIPIPPEVLPDVRVEGLTDESGTYFYDATGQGYIAEYSNGKIIRLYLLDMSLPGGEYQAAQNDDRGRLGYYRATVPPKHLNFEKDGVAGSDV